MIYSRAEDLPHATIAYPLCLSVIGGGGFVLAGKLRRNPAPVYHSLRSARYASVFTFRARGAGTRKHASVAPRLRLGQFGIQ